MRKVIWVLLFIFMLSGCAGKEKVKNRKTPEFAGYAIQVGAFKNLDNAYRLYKKLEDQGIDTFYFKRDDGLFVVRFGDFKDYDQARAYAERLRRKGIFEDFFIAEPMDVKKISYTKREDRAKRDDLGFIIAETAKRFVGIPYKWGGNTVTDGMDCSGFTKAVYNLCGLSIPRTADSQFREGYPVDIDELSEGDLVFFGTGGRATHVGIYTGDGKMVHAPKRNDEIRISSIESGYFKKHYLGARRYY